MEVAENGDIAKFGNSWKNGERNGRAMDLGGFLLKYHCRYDDAYQQRRRINYLKKCPLPLTGVGWV